MPEWERKEGREQEISCQVKPQELGSLSLLPEIFPTQESNWGLLHCRWILYQLSYLGKQIAGSETELRGAHFLSFSEDHSVEICSQFLVIEKHVK